MTVSALSRDLPAPARRVHPPMTGVEWGLLLLLSLLWAGSFLFIGVAVKELPPITVVVLRLGFGGLLLYVVVRLRGRRMPTGRRPWGAFAVMGVFNNVVPFVLIAWAQTRIDAGLASILNATTPLFGVFVAHYFTTDERATVAKVVGVVIGFGGVAVMIGPTAEFGADSDIWAEMAVIGASICYAMSGVYSRRFSRMGIAPEAAATGQLTIATLLLLPVMAVVDQPWTLPVPGSEVLASLFGLVILSTVGGYLIYYRLIATAGATNLMLVTLLIPPSAMLLGVTFLEEEVTGAQIAGLALIALGLAAIDGRLWRLVRRRFAG